MSWSRSAAHKIRQLKCTAARHTLFAFFFPFPFFPFPCCVVCCSALSCRQQATAAAWMASASASSSCGVGAAPPSADRTPLHAAGAPVDTTQLDKLCEKALTASSSGRHVLAAAFYRYAAEEALNLHGETFVCTYLTLRRALSLGQQAELEGVTKDEKVALFNEEWALTFGCLQLIVRRMDDNMMLPGRGTAVELAFFKRFTATRDAAFGHPPASSRELQLVGLSLGFETAIRAATRLLALCIQGDVEAEAFVLRVMDCMLPAARSLTEITLGDELRFADTIQNALSGASIHNATFVASIRSKCLRRWCRCAGSVAC